MTRSPTRKARHSPKRTVARPLDMLVFLLPLILFHEIASFARQDRVIAFDLLRQLIDQFGRAGLWAPGLAVIVILLATHVVSGDRWTVRWRRVGWMYVESVAFALPLLLLNWAVPLESLQPSHASWVADGLPLFLDRVALGIGAGVYEELIFRLILISIVLIVGVDLMRQDSSRVIVVAVAVSSLVFAAHHHRPIGVEPFDPIRFLFRTIAGVYLAAIFWYRGYGSAAGCHAAYNVVLLFV